MCVRACVCVCGCLHDNVHVCVLYMYSATLWGIYYYYKQGAHFACPLLHPIRQMVISSIIASIHDIEVL